jgi:hypothetical protein
LGKKWNSCPSQPDAVKQGKTKETTKKLNELAGKPWRSEAWELAVALADLLRNGCELKATNVWDHYLDMNSPLCILVARRLC